MMMINKNSLNKSEYLISKDLQNALSNEVFYDSKDMAKRPGIYIVAFRLLKNGDNVLIYNYTYYPSIFTKTYLHFLACKNDSSIRFSEWGDQLVLVNKDVLFNLKDLNEDNIKNVNRYDLNKPGLYDSILEGVRSYYVASDTNEIVRIINKLNFITQDYNEMGDFINAAHNKNYDTFAQLVLPSIYDYLKERLDQPLSQELNLINTLLFVVQDINKFISTIKEQNKDFIINEGNQKWRGQINSMNSLLNSMDIDYRNSLYNHNKLHVMRGNIDKKFELDRGKFSFRNIHMNLGNVRWYSTKRKVNRDVLSKKLIERIESKTSFKSESEMFLYLSNYIRNSPINETTERNIENYLLNFYTQALDEKKNNSLIKYDLFSNIAVKKYIKESADSITDYLSNFRKRSFNINIKRVTSKLNSSYHLSIILKELDDSFILEFCLGILARIINGFNKATEDSIAHNIIIDLGDMILRSYFYSLYKNYIIINIKELISKCYEYLDVNDNISAETKEVILKKLSEIERKYHLDVYDIKILVKNLLEVKELHNLDYNFRDLILNYTLSDWKLDNKKLLDSYDNNLKFGMASVIIDWMKESNLIQENLLIIGRTERRTCFIPADNLVKILKNNKVKAINSLPVRIPMIVKPNLYLRKIDDNGNVKEILGGYLINDEKVTDSMIIPNWELKESSIIKDPNVVYNLVNNVNSVGFKINKDMLNFIYSYGDHYNLILNNNINTDISKSKINKRDYTELESYESKLDLQRNILGLAEVYSLVSEFYLPVRIDYRGRMNCISQYLNYQSTELAKALLLFSKGEKLMKNDATSISYFKAYGANCFGNKLDKKSWVERSKWIDDNKEDIINYTNGKLINQADNKLLFIAFCIEYNKWLKSYDNIETSYFETHLPIQLDATCNGYQHLSLLISDYDMAKELNLTKSNKEDNPKDYYGFIIIKLIELFKNKLNYNNLSKEDRDCYERLSNWLITRSTIKKAIMTIPYNVSTPQMIVYIKEHFIDISDYKKGWSCYDLCYKYKEDSDIILCSKDISLVASGLREVLETNFPRLKLLILYLKTIAKIFNKLNLYIPWGTSSGLLVNQSYTSSEEIKLRPFSYSKSSFTLKMSTGRLSGNKQIRAFMPNLIHSLDAAALALLADYHFTSTESKSFYAIHDCFAVTANNIEMLIKFLKLVYIKIYSEDDYLRNFDKELIRRIKYHYGENSYNAETREINIMMDKTEIKEKFPDINIVLGTQLPTPELIADSSYLIN